MAVQIYDMGRFSIGFLLSLIVTIILGVFIAKFILKALFFGLAVLLLIGFIAALAKRL